MSEPTTPARGVKTTELGGTVGGAIVAISAMLTSTSAEVQVAALWAMAIIVGTYSIARAIVKLAG